MAWVRQWLAMTRKHGVLSESVEALVEEALRLQPAEGAGDAEVQRFNLLKSKLRQRREPKVIAIGDVHGCVDEVRQLIKVRGVDGGAWP